MKQIKLTQGKFAIVDDEDYEWLNQHKWYFRYARTKDQGYVVRGIWNNSKKNMDTIRMHRFVIKAKDHQVVDHINGNTLDNRKENLRLCNNSQNKQNEKKRKDNVSGYKGVHQKGKKWQARISVEKKRIPLGYFDNKEDAAEAYKNAAKAHFGEFARIQ